MVSASKVSMSNLVDTRCTVIDLAVSLIHNAIPAMVSAVGTANGPVGSTTVRASACHEPLGK